MINYNEKINIVTFIFSSKFHNKFMKQSINNNRMFFEGEKLCTPKIFED